MIVDDLKRKIDQGILLHDERIMPELEMTEYYQVSRVTVQHALDYLIQEGYIVRHQGKGTFVSSDRYCSNGKNKKMISLILTDSNKLLINMIEAIDRVLSEQGYFITLHITNNNVDYEREVCERVRAEGTSGIVIFPISDSYNVEYFTALALADFPIVFVDKCPARTPCNLIMTNGFISMYNLTKRIVLSGQRNLWFYSSRLCDTIVQRKDGFLLCAQRYGVEVPGIQIGIETPQKEFLERMLIDAPSPCVLLCGNDIDAISCIKWLRSKGVSIPEEVSVTGFDNDKLAQDTYSLTTISQDFSQIGTLAAENILRQLECAHSNKQITYVNGTVIQRASLAFPPLDKITSSQNVSMDIKITG